MCGTTISLARTRSDSRPSPRIGSGVEISGLAGLYAHFLLLGDAWLADGGLAIWLIPSEFMDVNYGAALKILPDRARHAPADPPLLPVGRAVLRRDGHLGDRRLREGAAAPRTRGPHVVRRPALDPAASESVPLATLRSARKWTAFPGNGARRPSPATTLGDFFTIKRGLATGANAFFILERAEARSAASRRCSSSRSCRARATSGRT